MSRRSPSLESTFLVQNDAPDALAADVIGIDGSKAIVQRAEDQTIEFVRTVPGLLDVPEEHGVSPFVASDVELASIGIVHADQVRIFGWIFQQQW